MHRVVFLLSLLLVACPSSPSSSCVCAADEFCCIDRCLPFGSTCAPDAGAVDAPGPDAPAAIDCGPRTTPEGGTATSLSRCMGDAIWWCSGTPTPCNSGYGCVEWLDPVAGAYRAACTDGGSAACDPAAPPRCDGDQLVTCSPSPFADAEDGPPGLVVPVDCPATYGVGSTCTTDADGAHCTEEACDPSTFVSSCIDDESFSACTDGTRRVTRCAATRRCLANALTAPGATCIPRGARESAVVSAEYSVIGCTGEALLVAQYGYEWGEACDGSWVCRETAIGFRCADPLAETCDASYAPSCADALRENRCVGGLVTPWYCGIALISGSVPSACDPDTGRCVPTTSCGPLHEDRCDASHRYRLQCDDTHGRQIATPCPSCTDAPGGPTCG